MMDTVTAVSLIFITGFVNILVNVLIGTYFQKKIENSYNVEMEKYRSSLERFNFEYQTKFSRKMPKALEVLETTYQKFSDSEIALQELDETFTDLEWHKKKDKDDIQRCRENFALKVQETLRYFENNRIFISDLSITEVSSILERARKIVRFVNIDKVYGEIDDKVIQEMNHTIKYLELDVREVNNVDRDLGMSSYFLDLVEMYAELSRQLEKHYKSVLEG